MARLYAVGESAQVARRGSRPRHAPRRLARALAAGSLLDGPSSAKSAGLRYASDREAGIARRGTAHGFVYRDPSGQPVDRDTRRRIRALAIPPAWTDVWIAPDPRAHLQATGRDARGRKQYRYHARWSAVRDSAKYDRLRAFGRALPAIRRRVAVDLHAPVLSRPWVLATVVRVLERAVIRIGNDEYRRANGSYGLTTLLARHARVHGGVVTLRFRAKSGVKQAVDIVDPLLARHVRRCQELPGQTLFQYVDEIGKTRPIGSSDVNDYVREAAGGEFTAKDFRTWSGTLVAACALDRLARERSSRARKRDVLRALDYVASTLGNTRAVCRKCYVHPWIIEAYLKGETLSSMPASRPIRGLSAGERGLLAMLDAGARRSTAAAGLPVPMAAAG